MRFADITLAACCGSGLLSPSCDGSVNGRLGVPGVDTRGKGRKVTCDDCFFGKNGLCALGLEDTLGYNPLRIGLVSRTIGASSSAVTVRHRWRVA